MPGPIVEILAVSDVCGDPATVGAQALPPCRMTVSPDTPAAADAKRELEPLNSLLLNVSMALALGALLVGAAVWAVSASQNNSELSIQARRAIIASLLAAFFLGAMPFLINFWITFGKKATL